MLIRAEDGTICVVENYHMIKIRGEGVDCVLEAICYNGQSSSSHSFQRSVPGEHIDLTGQKNEAEAHQILDRIIGSQGANVDLRKPQGQAPAQAGWAPL